MKPDPIEILVQHQAAALVRHGAKVEEARAEAEGIVEVMLHDLSRAGLHDVPVRLGLMRALVYRLRSSGVKAEAVATRLGVTRRTVTLHYRAERERRRRVA